MSINNINDHLMTISITDEVESIILKFRIMKKTLALSRVLGFTKSSLNPWVFSINLIQPTFIKSHWSSLLIWLNYNLFHLVKSNLFVGNNFESWVFLYFLDGLCEITNFSGKTGSVFADTDETWVFYIGINRS